MTSAMHPDFIRAAELLAVPRPDHVRPEQAEGTACVWCDREPTVDLGPRLSTRAHADPGPLHRWRPGACRSCAGREAARVYGIHVTHCQRCLQHVACPDARALRELAEGHW